MTRLLRVSYLRASALSTDVLDLLLPDENTQAQDALIKVEPGTLIWHTKLPDRSEAVVKMYRRRSLLHLSSRFVGSFRARREYDALARLWRRGVPCTEPLFWAHGETADHGRFELLATRRIEGTVRLDDWLEGASAAARAEVLCSAYRQVRAMHASGVRHGGLSFKNLLVSPAERTVFLIDFNRSVLFPFDLAGTRMGRFDLADLTAKVGRGFGRDVCAPALAGYGLAPPGVEQVMRFAQRHASTRRLRSRLRIEFRVRAGLGALLRDPRTHAALGLLLQEAF